MIVGLFPELSSAGGVQRAGRLTAAALMDFAARHEEEFTFLSLNDPANVSIVKIGLREIPFRGFGRSKRRFIAAALSAAGKRPNLAIALHPNLAPIMAAMKLRSPRTRTIVFAHGIEVWRPLSPIRRCSLRFCDLMLAPSTDTVLQVIKHQGIAPKKTAKLAWSLGPEFAPHSHDEVRPAHQLPESYPKGTVILTVGRWDAAEKYKGLDQLIAAIPELLQEVSDLHLVAVGGGSDLPRLERLARQSGASERIHFLPFLQTDQLEAVYESCDVFALPSRGEGFGLVFLEAMSHGKPVIGGAHGGTPDIIEDGVTGYLVQHGDVSTLAERLRRLLTNRLLQCQIGAAARECVRRTFTFERFASELAKQLETLLARSQ